MCERMKGAEGSLRSTNNHLGESDMPYSHPIFFIFANISSLNATLFKNVTHVFLLLEWNATLENPILLMVAHNIHKAAG